MKKTIYTLFLFAFQFTFSQSADILLNGTVSAEDNQIKNVSTPTDSNDAATKYYVDSNISNSNNSINSNLIGLTGWVHDNDGNRMQTIIMCDGSQWTVDFLRVTTFNNGDPITLANEPSEWANNENPAYSDDGPSSSWGNVYNLWAVEDDRGLAPEGWHIANEEDWASIVECLGGEEIAGGKLKNKFNWSPPNIGATNSSGLSIMPGGAKEGANGNWYNVGYYVGIWQASNRTDNLRPYTELAYDLASVNFGLTDFYDGIFILLVKD